jgi:hypothetical protein
MDLRNDFFHSVFLPLKAKYIIKANPGKTLHNLMRCKTPETTKFLVLLLCFAFFIWH